MYGMRVVEGHHRANPASKLMDGALSAKFDLALLGRFELNAPQGVVELPGGKLAGLRATTSRPRRRCIATWT